jgi:hypothetical protein
MRKLFMLLIIISLILSLTGITFADSYILTLPDATSSYPQIDYNDWIWVSDVASQPAPLYTSVPKQMVTHKIQNGWIYRGTVDLYRIIPYMDYMYISLYQGYLYNTGHMTG